MTREEAIKWIANLSDDIGAMRHQELWHYRQALDEIKDILECDYFADWIPCSEHLPEGEVLCCDIHGNLMNGYAFASVNSNTGYNAESEQEYMYDCVAWMPLPSPYKGEE